MEKKKTDRRIRKTKAQLRSGLLELLKDKKIQDITVQELVDKVDINRSTFYLHYKDIYDLLEQIEKDYNEDFTSFMKSHIPEKGTANVSEDEIIRSFVDYFNFLKDNKDLATVLIGYHGDPAFSRHQIKTLTDNICELIYGDLGLLKSQNNKDVVEYCTFGTMGLVRNWVINGFVESPEKLGSLAGNIIISTVQKFMQK